MTASMTAIPRTIKPLLSRGLLFATASADVTSYCFLFYFAMDVLQASVCIADDQCAIIIRSEDVSRVGANRCDFAVFSHPDGCFLITIGLADDKKGC